MAPRRLLAVMVGLLVLSSVAAALVPVNRNDTLDTTQPKTGVKLPPPRLPAGGRLIEKTIAVGSGKRPIVNSQVGDQLALRVTGKQATTLEVMGLGATADLDPAAPARFNLLLLDPGRFEITELESGRVVATIEVGPRQTPAKGKQNQEKGSDSGQSAPGREKGPDRSQQV